MSDTEQGSYNVLELEKLPTNTLLIMIGVALAT